MSMGIGTTCNAMHNGRLHVPDEERCWYLHLPQFNWFPRHRSPDTFNGGTRHFYAWRRSSLATDLASGMGDWATSQLSDYLEYPKGAGKRGDYFVNGQIVDTLGVAVTGVTCLLFRASDSLFVSSGISDASGNYQLPTPYIGVNHFVVAQLDAAQDVAGATIGNLVPTSS